MSTAPAAEATMYSPAADPMCPRVVRVRRRRRDGPDVWTLELEGHRDEPAIKAALDKLAASAAYLKTLGSYPVAVY